MILTIILWASAIWLTFGAIATIATIGKDRKPTTHGVAIFVVLVSAVIVTALVAAAIRLG